MESTHRRHDIPDHVWKLLEPHLLGRKGTWEGDVRNNRRFINAVLWILRTGAPWRDLPTYYGDWKNAHRRFCRWREKGVWEGLLEVLMDEAGFEWLITDASHIKAHAHAAGVRSADQAQRYIWPWMRMICRSESLLHQVPQRIALRLASSLKE